MTKTQNFWNHLTSTLWFIPILLALFGTLLGFIFVGIDLLIGDDFGYFPQIFGVQPSGASNMLAIIASSTITVAGTVYSITIVALTLASTQFSPRTLRNFIRDTGNQLVLGMMLGIFSYCIVVLGTIRSGGDDAESFVPKIAVMFGIFLGLIGICFLIYFIHHVATSIQATSIISAVAEETILEIERSYLFLYDEKQYDENILPDLANFECLKINSNATGYIQNADTEALIELAEKYDLIVQMHKHIGEFTIKSLPLLQIYARNQSFLLNENIIKEFTNAYDIRNFRTIEGDAAFGIRQIVDIALKALSPAVNDTTTGISCIDYLTAILVSLARRASRPPFYFSQNTLRLIINQQRFEDYFDLSFNQIRQNAAGNVAIILRMLHTIEILGKINQSLKNRVERDERHTLFETQMELLLETAERSISTKPDLQVVLRLYNETKEILNTLR